MSTNESTPTTTRPHKITYVALGIACLALVISMVSFARGGTPSSTGTPSPNASQGPSMMPMTSAPGSSGGSGSNSGFGPGAPTQ